VAPFFSRLAASIARRSIVIAWRATLRIGLRWSWRATFRLASSRFIICSFVMICS